MRIKHVRFYLLTAAIVATTLLVAGELIVRIASPTEYLYPRYKFSREYGALLFENTKMVHGVPGKFKFVYKINELGLRGDRDAGRRIAETETIIVLGDSYAFGMGVSDGEEFSSVLDRELAGKARVLNLACPGWSLTQEIRRFYEMGLEFNPSAVVLQFCSNDPQGNLMNRVTTIADGRLVFRDCDNRLNWFKKYLSRSIIQRSQLYNFGRGRLAGILAAKMSRRRTEALGNAEGTTSAVSTREKYYNDLLELYAADLRSRDIPLEIISVDHQLDNWPGIKQKIDELEERGDLDYLEVTEWFEDLGEHRSVEGHLWDWRAHEVIARRLADYFRGEVLTDDS